METNFGIHNPSHSATIHPFHKAGKNQHSQEEVLEVRIRHLGDQIENLNANSHVVWLKTGPHIYNSELDLSVKVEAIRWMLRIAKNMHHSAREVILIRIQNSLDQLEQTLEVTEWANAT
jgi:hypothetical protein